MKRWIAGLLSGLALISVDQAKAQITPPQGQAAVDPVTVRAANRKRLLNYAQAVSELSADRQISRRPDRLCPYVAGASAEVNTYVSSRIRQVGEQVGVVFESKACRPNLLVLFSREPNVMLQKARARRKISLEPKVPSKISRFLSDNRPVRWWSNVTVEPSSGGTVEPSGGGVGEVDSVSEPLMLRTSAETRMWLATRSVIRGSLIVVDARQTDGIEIGALADYVALAALVDLKPGADLSGHSSILNLFAEGQRTEDAPRRLTPLDMAYLRGVYKARDSAYGMNQLGKIATVMAEDLER